MSMSDFEPSGSDCSEAAPVPIRRLRKRALIDYSEDALANKHRPTSAPQHSKSKKSKSSTPQQPLREVSKKRKPATPQSPQPKKHKLVKKPPSVEGRRIDGTDLGASIAFIGDQPRPDISGVFPF